MSGGDILSAPVDSSVDDIPVPDLAELASASYVTTSLRMSALWKDHKSVWNVLVEFRVIQESLTLSLSIQRRNETCPFFPIRLYRRESVRRLMSRLAEYS